MNNRSILAELLVWGRDLEGFKSEHASNALLVVQGYVEGVQLPDAPRVRGIGSQDIERFSLFAKDLTWTFWLDEWFDSAERGANEFLDVDAVVRAIHGGEVRTPESAGFAALARSFAEYSRFGPEYELWKSTAEAAVRAWGVEERLSRGALRLTYDDYVRNGVNSTAVPHIVATASLLYGFRMAVRVAEERVGRLVRNLSISCRLHNDLYSVEKERREGCLANAVLLRESSHPNENQHGFVAEELSIYERRIREDVAALGEGDPFGTLATIMPATHQVLYTNPRGQYSLIE